MGLLKISVAGNAARQWLLIAVSHVLLYDVKRSIAANEAHFGDCCRNMGHFLCGVERESVMWTPIWIVTSVAWNGQAKCRLCRPLENFCWSLCLCCLCLQCNICFVLSCKYPFSRYSSILCCNLLVTMSLNVRFTTNRVCMKSYTHVYEAWTCED